MSRGKGIGLFTDAERFKRKRIFMDKTYKRIRPGSFAESPEPQAGRRSHPLSGRQWVIKLDSHILPSSKPVLGRPGRQGWRGSLGRPQSPASRPRSESPPPSWTGTGPGSCGSRASWRPFCHWSWPGWSHYQPPPLQLSPAHSALCHRSCSSSNLGMKILEIWTIFN